MPIDNNLTSDIENLLAQNLMTDVRILNIVPLLTARNSHNVNANRVNMLFNENIDANTVYVYYLVNVEDQCDDATVGFEEIRTNQTPTWANNIVVTINENNRMISATLLYTCQHMMGNLMVNLAVSSFFSMD